MFRVRVASTEIAVPLPPDASLTAGFVKQFVMESNLEIDVLPSQLRLIVKGKILADDDVVDATQTAAAPAVIHILPSEHEIQNMLAREAEAKRIHDIRATRHVVSIQARNEHLSARAHASITYKFRDIETLPGLPNEPTARNILVSLASDPGILAVLAHHKWQVGALVEMYPDGKVGVDPVCVLGLNENKGQRIRLRLRTDDLLGFRKFLTIKQVLFHELSHNEVSDHNNDFYQLMRQVETECNAVPMTRSSALVQSSRRPTASPVLPRHTMVPPASLNPPPGSPTRPIPAHVDNFKHAPTSSDELTPPPPLAGSAPSPVQLAPLVQSKKTTKSVLFVHSISYTRFCVFVHI
ncbi:hypothetical protein, variant [Aphanomyces astaci]|uniref:WLM domain-containing protein n=1 Tax=Aphanomyces astaci TaxID=112090 RepID=W4FVA6_APHAT|nr:hypothetical protein, variant [Aphanomyces astaci]ETV71450.1 hypothetical protein, variant [Aphanomyces astaci]|eukprot:XP_009839114.1 hypothetical protein, variant [Aphanomyces astaci]